MLSAGSMVGGYRIEKLLGSGGMGAVYLAANPTLPRHDALKVLSAELSRDRDFRARFIREAEVASALDHPNIVAVYNRGETEDGQLWIAMQYVEGTDADDALRTGTMTPQRAVHIIGEVAKALDHAHARNVVHRDVKPANFLLSGQASPAERVLLGDFGIARALDDVSLTVTGSVMATVAYAAPEVLSGMPFDGRADVYSLGCTLFRLLTGKTPFSSANGMAAMMMAHLQSPPPRVTDFVPSLPAALDMVIATAMAKSPADRFASAGALGAAAASALHDSPGLTAMPFSAVPSGEVVSYPDFVPTAAGPWWQPSGPRTMMAGPSSAPPPSAAPPRRRRRGLVAAAVSGVVVLVVAAVAVVAWPTDAGSVGAGPPVTTSGPSPSPSAAGGFATDVSGSQLRSILLTPNEIPGGLTLESDGSDFLTDAGTVAPTDCLGSWAPAQQGTYAGSGATAVAVQSLRAMNSTTSQDGVVQSVVAFSDGQKAGLFLVAQRGQWGVCGTQAVIVTPPGAPAQTWTLAPSVTSNGVVTVAATLAGGGTSCQRGMQVRGNVIIDVRQCHSAGGNDVVALVTAMAAKVPRQ
ncbi:serine/threonine-protein kinase [Mycolicibacterium sp. BK556]|uniref:serine/threonine-protein kinase PknH/PknJ n=1 Tax=Mycobacteriaceae TaxID=1762 RepID=UPI0010E74B3B|nr:serine/threonine-protein kinase [Mycolicibacterium sp. BK556]MBB3636093.1 serine/threonine-protein kinase [Mycolicibacterium sp. BK607]TDO06570.1 serine/threonine-protein kinase [Mycobacterium sp. BK086]